MENNSPILISIVTATYNAAEHLPKLIDSLQNQTDQDFEWIVADGGSNDKTLSLLDEAKKKLLNLRISVQNDTGIYDALNRAISISSASYYLVLGADDTLLPHAIAAYKEACFDLAFDLITANVIIGNTIRSAKKPAWLWLHGAPAKISSHAVGLLVKKDLHQQYGFYNLDYRLYSDGFFMLKALRGGAKLKQIDVCVGEFAITGASNRNQFISFREQLRAQVSTGSNLLLQLFLFCLRILKWSPSLYQKAISTRPNDLHQGA